MRYKPEFNCMIRSLFDRFGGLPDVQIRIINTRGNISEVLQSEYGGSRITTLTPNPDGGRPRKASWCPEYRAMSFPVSLGKIVHDSKGCYIQVYMDNDTVVPDDELPMYLEGMSDDC